VRNSLLVNYVMWRRKYNGAQDKHRSDELDLYLIQTPVVEERSICIEAKRASDGGAYRSENAGMSNANQSRLLITEYPRFPQHCTSTAG